MTLTELWQQSVLEFRHSQLFDGTVSVGITFLSVFLAILLLLGVTFLLRQFFKRYAFINHAHKILIYMLTMSGVILLILAGILGLVLPLIPGIPLLLGALMLIRKYHKFRWIEITVAYCKRKLGRNQEKVNKSP